VAEAAPSHNLPAGPLHRHHLLLRRLHSLTGIVPVGVFLIAHLLTNSSLAWGKAGLRGAHPELGWQDGGVAYFAKEVRWINTQVPHLLLVEIVLWVSIAFHAGLGLVYARSGRGNYPRYPYISNLRYTLQRLTGYIALVFIFYHVATLRWGWSFLVPGGTEWSADYAASSLAAAIRGAREGWTLPGMGVAVLYFAGVTATVFHFANGLWTAAITWGLTISAAAQRRWGYVCAAVGAGLLLAGWSALGAALLLDPERAARVEAALIPEASGPARQHAGMKESP
jgi:succinate dehydrogenase / fumarate reductase cytochrome b subunit